MKTIEVRAHQVVIEGKKRSVSIEFSNYEVTRLSLKVRREA